MVTISFKLSEIGEIQLSIDSPESLDHILQQCMQLKDFELGGYIAVRAGKVIGANDSIENGDSVDIYPAISGG